jgi:CheY-like chemotaxis protein
LGFTLEMDETLPDTLEGDAGKLSQCIGYLLDNAIKFTPGGAVTLRAAAVERGREGLVLKVSVIDSGIGFSTPQDGSLYQRFHQLDGSMTREYGGLGVGLAICRKLVGLMGGGLSHQSEVGEGSNFELTVPLFLTGNASPAASATPREQPRRGTGQPLRRPEDCTVLVVEDNGINQLVMRGMLLKLGYRVRCADNGADALELLRREPMDAVLLDCQMPIMDGFATCRALRSMPSCAELPVLAITAHSHSGDRERCLAAGMSDYLAKPVKFEALQALLHDWLLCLELPVPVRTS